MALSVDAACRERVLGAAARDTCCRVWGEHRSERERARWETTPTSCEPGTQRCALVVAHPGHEVRTFGWYERARPTLFVLTAGTRAGAEERIWFSRRIADKLGAPVGELFGSFHDRAIYEAVLGRRSALFAEWVGALANALAALEPELVVSDGWQMYNLSHDLVHVMARVAVAQAARRLGRAIQLLEYDTVPRQLGAELPVGAEVLRVELDDAALARKHAVAVDYPDLRSELAEVLSLEGLDAQRTEIYRAPLDLESLLLSPRATPPYERFGAERVAAGVYRECIRWSTHVRPIAQALLQLQP